MFDILVAWPQHLDYPLFRRLVTDNMHQYSRLIVALTGLPQGEIVSNYVKSRLAFAHLIPPRNIGADWRHEAMTAALAASTAEYVLFLEQDFCVYDPDAFFGKLRGAIIDGVEFVGFRDLERIHPACLLVKRELLDKTSRNFAAGDKGHDHFWQVTEQLSKLAQFVSLESLGLERDWDWKHLAGLTHNYDLMLRGEQVTYKPVEFALYNLICLRVGSCPDFTQLMQTCAQIAPPERLVFGK